MFVLEVVYREYDKKNAKRDYYGIFRNSKTEDRLCYYKTMRELAIKDWKPYPENMKLRTNRDYLWDPYTFRKNQYRGIDIPETIEEPRSSSKRRSEEKTCDSEQRRRKTDQDWSDPVCNVKPRETQQSENGHEVGVS